MRKNTCCPTKIRSHRPPKPFSDKHQIKNKRISAPQFLYSAYVCPNYTSIFFWRPHLKSFWNIACQNQWDGQFHTWEEKPCPVKMPTVKTPTVKTPTVKMPIGQNAYGQNAYRSKCLRAKTPTVKMPTVKMPTTVDFFSSRFAAVPLLFSVHVVIWRATNELN